MGSRGGGGVDFGVLGALQQFHAGRVETVVVCIRNATKDLSFTAVTTSADDIERLEQSKGRDQDVGRGDIFGLGLLETHRNYGSGRVGAWD